MQALQLTKFKHPPDLREVDDPTPAPGEVLIRIGGAGACHSDLHLIHDFDESLVPFKLPFTLGHENAGWVEELGAGVTGLEVGQPVAVYGPWGCGTCKLCLEGRENYCTNQAQLPYAGGGLGRDGGMAPLLLVPSARLLVPLSDLNPVDAAPLTDAGLTPYSSIKRSLSLLVPGSTAVVIGAGGLGHMAIQLLDALTTTRIIAVDSNPDALRYALDAGAAHAFAPGPEAIMEIRSLTRGVGAELVLDIVGVNDTLAFAAAVIRPLGHLTLVGIGGGSFPFGFFTAPYGVSLATTYWGSLPELVEVLALAEAGKVRAEVVRYELADAAKAYDDLAAGRVRGRAVVVP